MNGEEEEKISFWKTQTGIAILLSAFIGIVFSCSFVLGAWYGCVQGDGKLYGLRCLDVNIVDSCESLTGKVYTIPPNYTTTKTNTSVNIGGGIFD